MKQGAGAVVSLWCLSGIAVVKAVGLPLFHKNFPSFGRTEPCPSVWREHPVEVSLHLMRFLCTVPLVKAAFRASRPWQRWQGRSVSPAPNQAEGRRSGYALPRAHACALVCFLGSTAGSALLQWKCLHFCIENQQWQWLGGSSARSCSGNALRWQLHHDGSSVW